jgi:hypothetical protein
MLALCVTADVALAQNDIVSYRSSLLVLISGGLIHVLPLMHHTSNSSSGDCAVCVIAIQSLPLGHHGPGTS